MFTNKLVNIIGEQAIDALIEYDNPHKRRAIDVGEGSMSDDGERTTPSTRQKPKWNWERARQAVFEDYMSPEPTFNDHQFERMFRITTTVMEELRTLVGNEDDFFTSKTCAVTR
jgi:hypothetical protein